VCTFVTDRSLPNVVRRSEVIVKCYIAQEYVMLDDTLQTFFIAELAHLFILYFNCSLYIMAEVNSKCCSVCNVFKPFIKFNNRKDSKDGYHSQCKDCRRMRELMSISREENRPPMMIVVDGEPTICKELSLPELKALQKRHKIILSGHYNKNELVEVLK
jgi:hypothetical protein